MHILLTGASGFVGKGLLMRFVDESEYRVRAALRPHAMGSSRADSEVPVGDLGGGTDWREALADCQVVIHSAARVHVMNDAASDPLIEFRKVNVEGTLNLAAQAATSGVKRFIFISSIKVNGEGTSLGSPYTAEDSLNPVDPYGVSKLEAERGLRKIASETGMEVVIIRPVLVYGPGVKANFHTMMSWLNKGIPLPLGTINNRRSLVALDNLVDLILTCVTHPSAANQTFLVSDGEDLSTTELLRRMGSSLGKPARLLPVPSWLLVAGAALIGKRSVSDRLCGSLQVDINKTHEVLSWSPPVSVDEALSKTAIHFLEQKTS